MTPHRHLAGELACFHDTAAGALFGSPWEAYCATIGLLTGPDDVILIDEVCRPAAFAGCRLSGAEVIGHRHGDLEHLGWGLRRAGGRAALVVTEGVFALDGSVAPLAGIAGLTHRFGARLVVDETHGVGALGPGGRGASAQAGVEDEVDVIVGSLGSALGASGAYVCGDACLVGHLDCAGPSVPVAAAASAALELLREQPRRVDKLQANAAALREALSEEGFDLQRPASHILAVSGLGLGSGRAAARMVELAMEEGVLVGTIGSARLRLAVMASHTKTELRDAARLLGRLLPGGVGHDRLVDEPLHGRAVVRVHRSAA